MFSVNEKERQQTSVAVNEESGWKHVCNISRPNGTGAKRNKCLLTVTFHPSFCCPNVFLEFQNVCKCDLFGSRDCAVSGQNDKGLMNHVARQCWVWFMPPTRLNLLRKNSCCIEAAHVCRQSCEFSVYNYIQLTVMEAQCTHCAELRKGWGPILWTWHMKQA